MSRSYYSGSFKQLAKLVAGLILAGAGWLASALPANAGQHVTLAWYPSGDTNVVGYKIYYGTESHNYTAFVDTGSNTQATITLPTPGVTYYFAATAYDSTGTESDFSNETSYAAPATASLTSAVMASGQFSFTVNGTTNATYVVQASTNLVNWVPVQTNTAPFTFVDPNSAGMGHCFFRAVLP